MEKAAPISARCLFRNLSNKFTAVRDEPKNHLTHPNYYASSPMMPLKINPYLIAWYKLCIAVNTYWQFWNQLTLNFTQAEASLGLKGVLHI